MFEPWCIEGGTLTWKSWVPEGQGATMQPGAAVPRLFLTERTQSLSPLAHLWAPCHSQPAPDQIDSVRSGHAVCSLWLPIHTGRGRLLAQPRAPPEESAALTGAEQPPAATLTEQRVDNSRAALTMDCCITHTSRILCSAPLLHARRSFCARNPATAHGAQLPFVP